MRSESLTAVIAASALSFSCFMASAPGDMVKSNTNASANNSVEMAKANTSNTSAVTKVDSNANAHLTREDEHGKRISFARGSTWGTENVTLKAGQSKKFIVGAKRGQYLTVEPSSPDVKLLMVTKGKAAIDSEGDRLAASLGKDGDYIFEVRNPGSKEVKTSIRIEVVEENM